MEEKKIQEGYDFFWSISGFLRSILVIFRKDFGFTLVELLVVVAIIGILVSAALLILNPIAQIQKANDAKRKGDLSQIQKALETYYHDLGRYPASDSSYRIVYNGTALSWGSSWSPYMSILPKDQSPQRTYVYYSTSNGQSYYLYAYLERTNDPQLCNAGNPCSSLSTNGISTNACGSGGVCNFGVSSSNTSP